MLRNWRPETAGARRLPALALCGLCLVMSPKSLFGVDAFLSPEGWPLVPPLAAFLTPAAGTAGPGRLAGLRFEGDAGGVRLLVPFSGSWTERRLSDPPRLVLDLDGVWSDLPHAPALYETRLDLGPIRFFRTSQIGTELSDLRVRLTLELSDAVAWEIRRVGAHLVVAADSGPLPRSVLELGPGGWSRPEAKEIAEPAVGAATPATGAAAPVAPTEAVTNSEPPPPALRACFRPAATTEDALEGLRHLRLASDHLDKGETAPALAEYRRVAAMPAGELQLCGMIRAADLSFRLGRADSAAAFYERVLRFEPSDEEAAWASFQLGNCLRLTGQAGPARACYRELLDRWPHSVWAPLAHACLEP